MNRTLIFLLLCSLALLLAGDFFPPSYDPDFKGHDFEGVLLEAPLSYPDRTYLVLRLFPLDVKVRLTVGAPLSHLYGGEKIRFHARLKRPQYFANPGVRNYRRFLERRGVIGVGFLEDPDSIEVVGRVWWSPFYRGVGLLKNRINESLKKGLDPSVHALVRSITLGERSLLGKGLQEDFQKTGLAHLLAISGLNMAVVSAFFFQLSRWLLSYWPWFLFRFDLRKGAALASLPPLCLYLCLAGGEPSVLRAAIMVGIYLLAFLVERQREYWSALTCAALVIFLIQPSSLFEPSFQLSFVAVISLFIVFQEWGRLWGRPGWFQGLVLTSVAACFGTWPLVSFYFYEVPLLGVFNNLIFVPFMSLVILPLSFLAELLGLVLPFAASPCLWLLNQSTYIFLTLLHFSAGLSSEWIWQVGLTSFEVWAYYAGFLLFIFSIRWGFWKPVGLGLLLLTIIYVLWGSFSPYFDRHLQVTFFDVGQGDAAWVRFPGGRNMLIDGGGQGFFDPKAGEWRQGFDIGELVLRPSFLHAGRQRVDYLVLTHADSDHYAGLRSVARHFSIGEFWWNGRPSFASPFQELLGLLEGVPQKTGAWSQEIGGVEVEVLPRQQDRDSDNDSSVVIKMTYGEVSLLWTGDIEDGAEEDLVNSGIPLKVTVLKIPHHGSRTSSTPVFLEKVAPEVAVLSVGRQNFYHHPHPQVLKRYQDREIPLFRTDLHGAIEFTTDGVGYSLTKFSQDS